MQQELVFQLHQQLEAHVQMEDGVEFWYARELQGFLGYSKWESFIGVISRAKTACEQTGQASENHFPAHRKMVPLGSGSYREVEDFKLTRYACYLIAQNGNPSKPGVAFAQAYFASQTRRLELIQKRLGEVERIHARRKLTETEAKFQNVIFERLHEGEAIGRIRSKGDEALFGGFSTKTMKKKLEVPEQRPLADFLPTPVIKAKDLATELTNFTVERDDIQTEPGISTVHVRHNNNVREVLMKSGITPEQTKPAEDIKKLERRVASEEKRLAKAQPRAIED